MQKQPSQPQSLTSALLAILLFALFWMGCKSCLCNSSSTKVNNDQRSTTNNEVDDIVAKRKKFVNSIDVKKEPLKGHDYIIEKKEVNDRLATVYIYVRDTSQIKDINGLIFLTYNIDGDKWTNFFYFNKKGAAIRYIKSFDDHSLSNKEWESKYENLLKCNTTYNPNRVEETFDYN